MICMVFSYSLEGHRGLSLTVIPKTGYNCHIQLYNTSKYYFTTNIYLVMIFSKHLLQL